MEKSRKVYDVTISAVKNAAGVTLWSGKSGTHEVKDAASSQQLCRKLKELVKPENAPDNFDIDWRKALAAAKAKLEGKVIPEVKATETKAKAKDKVAA